MAIGSPLPRPFVNTTAMAKASQAFFPPGAVVFAHSTEEVSEIVKICAVRKVPIVPFGTGTSLEGHVAALRGGVCIDLTQMDKVLNVNAEDLDVTVQSGVRRKQLNEYLAIRAFFFPSIQEPTLRSAV